MAKWIAAYNEEDVPYGDEIRICIEGVETGFVAVPENGEDLGLYPVDTEEEAREENHRPPAAASAGGGGDGR